MHLPDFSEFDALVSLLDDKDSVVYEAVSKRLRSLGPSVVKELCRRVESECDPQVRSSIGETAQRINAQFRIEEFCDLTKRRQGPLSLFEGSFIISSFLDCRIRREDYEDLFFKCSSQYLAEKSDLRTAVENIRIFNHIFFHRLSFSIYDVEMRDSQYAFVERTLRSRKGNPFTIAFVYLMIAQVSGLPLKLMCFPGGFVPVYIENGKELFYIDIFRNGEIFLKDRLQPFLRMALGERIDEIRFSIKEPQAILSFYLESLQVVLPQEEYSALIPSIEQMLDCLGNERFLSVSDEEM